MDIEQRNGRYYPKGYGGLDLGPGNGFSTRKEAEEFIKRRDRKEEEFQARQKNDLHWMGQ